MNYSVLITDNYLKIKCGVVCSNLQHDSESAVNMAEMERRSAKFLLPQHRNFPISFGNYIEEDEKWLEHELGKASKSLPFGQSNLKISLKEAFVKCLL